MSDVIGVVRIASAYQVHECSICIIYYNWTWLHS